MKHDGKYVNDRDKSKKKKIRQDFLSAFIPTLIYPYGIDSVVRSSMMHVDI